MGTKGRMATTGRIVVAGLLCLSGCNRQPSQSATTMSAPQDFDKLIDDLSPAGMDAQRGFYRNTQKQLDALPTASLNRQQQADLAILRNTIGGSLLELDTIQSYRHNPTLYVELVGNALYTPFVLNY